jgi:hypothetical protein
MLADLVVGERTALSRGTSHHEIGSEDIRAQGFELLHHGGKYTDDVRALGRALVVLETSSADQQFLV